MGDSFSAQSRLRLLTITAVGILTLGAVLVYFVYFTISTVDIEIPPGGSAAVPADTVDRLLVTNAGRRVIAEMTVSLPGERVVIRDMPGASDHLAELGTDTRKGFQFTVFIRFQDGAAITYDIRFGGAPRRRCIELTVADDGRVF